MFKRCFTLLRFDNSTAINLHHIPDNILSSYRDPFNRCATNYATINGGTIYRGAVDGAALNGVSLYACAGYCAGGHFAQIRTNRR